MSTATGKSRRHVKKSVLKHVESNLDISRLDYQRRVRPAKGRSKMMGVVVASGIYFVGFGAGYFGWKSGVVADPAFAKLVWIMMVPASVAGAVTWMIADSRLEYPLRQELANYVADVEQDGGLLWRYEPLLRALTLKGINITQAIALSKAGKGGSIDPQDYADIVQGLYRRLTSQDGFQLTGDESAELERNLQTSA